MVHFFDNLSLALLYFLFTVTILLLWKKPFLSLVGTCGLGGFAVYLGRISPLGLGAFFVLCFGIYLYYNQKLSSWMKLVLGMSLVIVASLFYLHFIPGFNNWLMIDRYLVSPNAWPFSLYLNMDKIMVGIAFVALGQRLNYSWSDWKTSFKDALVPLFVITLVLMGAAVSVNYVDFDMKLSPILWLWVLTNLLFVCVSEEVLFRGFIQKELSGLIAHIKGGKMISLFVTSVIFGLFHYKGGPYYVLLSTIAGIGYGYAYMKSQKLEAAILTHFFLNFIHILFFTYPALLK